MQAFIRLQMFPWVALSITASIISTSCSFVNGGQGPAPQDTQPPEVYMILAPISPEHGDYITFIATADDESGVDTLAIFVDGKNVSQCQGNSADTHLQCEVTLGPYSQGQIVEYWAAAVDWQGNSAQGSTDRIEVGP